jgi:hypothetical protein
VRCAGLRSGWPASRTPTQHAGTVQAELVKLVRIPLLIIDEVGYILFEVEAANLFFIPLRTGQSDRHRQQTPRENEQVRAKVCHAQPNWTGSPLVG